MTDFRLVISNPKSGISVQKELKDPGSKKLIGLKITDKIKGELIDMNGYEFEITGGSDYCGFPMRRDVGGAQRKRILATSGVGIKKSEKGKKIRKSVCGNTIHAKTVQINLKVIKEGKDPIVAPKKEGEEKAAPKE
jgi:small subunit ribosomal protein S6e